MDKINGQIFRNMLESGCANLNNRKKEVDALNVFPVPDGDTGTNMSLTFTSGVSEVRKAGSEDLPTITKTLSRGMLMGARGNSGVILSQIFRGFNQSVGTNTELTTSELATAFMNGAMLAYKAVMRPVEGTILTVVRESTEYADIYVKDHPESSIEEYLDILCKEAKASLDRTPELLPVLKEARVVDSGGAGLVTILEGFRAYLNGAPIVEGESIPENEKLMNGYRTEFVLKLSEQGEHLFKETRFRETLSRIGENITVITQDSTVLVAVYTMIPGEVLNEGQKFGEFEAVQIDPNQGEGKDSLLSGYETEPAEEKEYAIITVCAGEGLANLFKNYRADYVVSGGQTMNPSTEDFVSAIKKLNAKHIFILPNNSNIIMAAKQAATVIDGVDVRVIETVSVPQGLSACISFNPDEDVDVNVENMLDAIAHVKSGSVTYAIKDTTVDGREIHNGDYMGISGKDIRFTSKDKVEATKNLIKDMCDEDSAIVTLIYGEGTTMEEVEDIQQFVEENFEVDIDVEEGGQPVYSFIIGVE